MKFPNNIRQFLPTEAVKQISQIINNPKLSEALKDAAEKAGFKDAFSSATLQPIQQVVDNATKWMDSFAKQFADDPSAEIVREGINATGEVFSSRWLGIPLSPRQSLQLAGSIRGVADASSLDEELIRLVCSKTGAQEALFVNSTLAGLFSLVSGAYRRDSSCKWILPRQNCIRLPRFGDASVASLPDILSATGVNVTEVGTTDDCDEAELLAALRDECCYTISISMPSTPTQRDGSEVATSTRNALLNAKSKRKFPIVEIVLDGVILDLQSKIGIGREIQSLWDEGVDVAIVPCEFLIGGSEGCIVLFREHSEIATATRGQVSASGVELSAISKRLLLATLNDSDSIPQWEQSELGQILNTKAENLLYRAQKIAKQIEGSPMVRAVEASVKPCRLGTGVWSEAKFDSGCVRIYPAQCSPRELAIKLASSPRPLWCNVYNEFLEIVLRTMAPDDDLEVVQRFGEPGPESDVRTESES